MAVVLALSATVKWADLFWGVLASPSELLPLWWEFLFCQAPWTFILFPLSPQHNLLWRAIAWKESNELIITCRCDCRGGISGIEAGKGRCSSEQQRFLNSLQWMGCRWPPVHRMFMGKADPGGRQKTNVDGWRALDQSTHPEKNQEFSCWSVVSLPSSKSLHYELWHLDWGWGGVGSGGAFSVLHLGSQPL